MLSDDTDSVLDDAELAQLEADAIKVEVKRLIDLGVLQPVHASEVREQQLLQLSARFVHSWRPKKIDGQNVFLRRARLVAREYQWQDPHREHLFAPASSSLLSRLLPGLFMQRKAEGHDWVMFTCDIRDSYLIVDQKTPTAVTIFLDGGEFHFQLMKCLPGQRDGARNWYEEFSGFLMEKLKAECCVVCPSIIRAEESLVGQLHVDDILGIGAEEYVMQHFLPAVKSRYEVTFDLMCKPGDELYFLKRRHVCHKSLRFIIQPHPKSFQNLFQLVGINPDSMKPRVAPMPTTGAVQELTADPLPEPVAGKYRAAVGLLLYLSTDLIECQFCIKTLAQCMSNLVPRRGGCSSTCASIYLAGVRHQAICFEQPVLHEGFIKKNANASMVLEAMTDSDWAGDRHSRKSTSSAVFTMNKMCIYSSSRTQKAVSLSSGEAEYYAMVSAACDLIYFQNIIKFCTYDAPLDSYLLSDSAAARGVMSRSGAGKIRHLDAKVLWVQQKLQDKVFHLGTVSTLYNLADGGTKPLNRDRVKLLGYFIGLVDGDVEDGYGSWEPVGLAEFESHIARENTQRAIRRIRLELAREPRVNGSSSTEITQMAKRVFAAGMVNLLLQPVTGDALSRAAEEPNRFDGVSDFVFIAMLFFSVLGFLLTCTWLVRMCMSCSLGHGTQKNQKLVYVTKFGKHYHQADCKWIRKRRVKTVAEVKQRFKKRHSCHYIMREPFSDAPVPNVDSGKLD